MYGLPKIHKVGVPIRPILSAVNTHSYKICKFLINLINVWSTNEFTVKDSFSFVSEICNLDNNNYYMASFDIKSLYTNIPLKETLNIILNRAFPTNQTLFHNFDKSNFKKFLELALLDTYFLFNNKLYKQIDGLAMGSPIAPVLANIFLNFHEIDWLRNCPNDIKPVLYRRFMDDTFLLFREESHVQPFLSYLNVQHNNIKFTCETEIDCKISFLDVKIHKTNNKFNTELYRKPTYTGQTTNFNSFIPFLYKLNLIKILIYRAFNISSNYFYLDLEFKNIINILNNNGFKTGLIE